MTPTRQDSRKISATAHPDVEGPRQVAYWLVTDDVRIGATRNGIQVADELNDRGTL
jgi:aspartate-semialdehyde dehydrogenase